MNLYCFTFRRVACIALAAQALVYARVRVALTTEPTLARKLTKCSTNDTASRKQPISEPWLRDLAWALCGLAAKFPFRTDCLVRVLAAERLLRDRGQITIHVQAGSIENTFSAHTWLTCQSVEITGGPVDGLEALHPVRRCSKIVTEQA